LKTLLVRAESFAPFPSSFFVIARLPRPTAAQEMLSHHADLLLVRTLGGSQRIIGARCLIPFRDQTIRPRLDMGNDRANLKRTHITT
jgi:hypothetical protein